MRRKHRRLRRKEIRKRRTMFVLSLFGVTFLLASGYAAFSTSLNINAKGNLKEKANTTIGGKKVYLSTSGDGLYTDPVEENRYVYRGANPDNYICLEAGSGTCSEGNMYRIIAKEADGTLKVIKNTSIGDSVWDPGYSTSISGVTNASNINGTRYSSTSTDYCYVSLSSSYYGCKSWGSKTNTYDSTGNTKVTSMPWVAGSTTLKNLPTYDSYINVYLNGGKYLATSSSGNSNMYQTITGWIESQNTTIKNNISENHIFNVGPLKNAPGQTLVEDISQEKAYIWKGNIGLINATDYVRANTNISLCGTVYANTNTAGNSSTCKTTNWLVPSAYQWTISPISYSYSYYVWNVYSAGTFGNNYALNSGGARPTFFLKSTTTLTGKGTNDSNVYRIA